MIKFLIVLIAVLCSMCGAEPFPYYDYDDDWTDHSITGLKDVLGMGLVEPTKEDVFDCSERSAYVDWVLKNHGFKSKICMDWRGPWQNEPHAWVGVQVGDEVVYIETNDASGRFVYVDYFDPDWDKYNIPVDTVDPMGMHQYNDIYTAIADGVAEDELDWWTVIKKN
jgi:hypothetical protein